MGFIHMLLAKFGFYWKVAIFQCLKNHSSKGLIWWKAYNFPIFQMFEDQSSNFACHFLTIFSVKRQLDTWMCAFLQNTKHLFSKCMSEIGKLEITFTKFCKIGKAIFPNWIIRRVGSRQTKGLHSMEPNCINVLAELAVFLLKIPRFWVRWENN